ncbi:hypothetical protein CR513_07701, partial [Mucuna pruriens]
MEKPGGGATPPIESIQVFWAQLFSEEIDGTPIPPNFREPTIKPFDGTQNPHIHLQAFQTQMYISGGNDSLSCKLFSRTLRANKTKRLEETDLFNIRQAKGETLKSYLAWFNNATVRVNDPNHKFFVKAFQKGLRPGQFRDQADQLDAKRQLATYDIRPAQQIGQKGEDKYPQKPKDYPLTLTPLAREKGADIARHLPYPPMEIPEGSKGSEDGSQPT